MNIVVCLSGGIDSAVTLATAIAEKNVNPLAVCFKYPSKHNKLERKASQAIADYYKVPLQTIDMTSIFEGGTSSLVDNNIEIPKGHYQDKSMESTVVPLRNNIFAYVAMSRAFAHFADRPGNIFVYLGVHQGDHPIYPDCRPESIRLLHASMNLSSDGRCFVYAPFLFMTKVDIVKLGLRHGVPLHLTRTCYEDSELACGECGSCLERLEAFMLNGAKDPVMYAEKA